MKLNEIRQELNNVKSYYQHKAEYDGYFAKGEMLHIKALVDKYDKAILTAPSNLYKAYIELYHNGFTQERASEELDITVRQVKRLQLKIFDFFKNVP